MQISEPNLCDTKNYANTVKEFLSVNGKISASNRLKKMKKSKISDLDSTLFTEFSSKIFGELLTISLFYDKPVDLSENRMFKFDY